MHILIACDSFKDALPAEAVCAAIARGFAKAHPDARITEMPLSDGGEGVLDILRRGLSLTTRQVEASDPLGRPILAAYGISADGGTALVSMAEASGLQRLTQAERDPLLTSTFGTGLLLADARAQGVRRALLAIGGSATNDAGVGMAAALGWRFLDAAGRAVPPQGGRLADIATIVPPPRPLFAQAEVLCDVTNPLYGPNGAAFVYARQKGGTDESIARLDAGLRHIAALTEKLLGRPGLAEMPGAGSGGAVSASARSPFSTPRCGAASRWCSTWWDSMPPRPPPTLSSPARGRIDSQSLQGKLIQGVCGRAGNTPVIALCGKLAAAPEDVRRVGLKAAYSINESERPLAEMLAATAANLERTAARLPL